MQELIANAKPLSAITPAAGVAAQTAITGSTIDTLDFSGVLFLVHVGPVVTGAVTTLKVQHSDLANMSDAADIEGSAQTIADTDDNLIRFSDLFRPTKRYIRLVVSRGTQDATIGSAVALLYGALSAPFTQTAVGETIAGPQGGTA
jgi:hypothetical protein